MDFMNNYDNEYTYESRPGRGRAPMATAALVLGILSISLCSILYVSLPCGAIAIICAVLSRDKHSMPGRSKAGVVCGIIGIVATVSITVSAFVYVLTTDAGRAYLNYYYQIYTGDYDASATDILDELFPFLYNNGTGDSDSGSGASQEDDSNSSSGNSQENDSDDSTGDNNDTPNANEPNDGQDSPEQSVPYENDSAEEGGFI